MVKSKPKIDNISIPQDELDFLKKGIQHCEGIDNQTSEVIMNLNRLRNPDEPFSKVEKEIGLIQKWSLENK